MSSIAGVFALVVLAFAIAIPLHAEDTTGASAEGATETGLPVLGEFRFMSSAFLPSPFITTDLRNTLGLGKASDVQTPILTIDDDVILGLEGDLLYALLDAQYQYTVQEWLAVWGRFQVQARLGDELQSVLAQGISVNNSFEVGWLFRVWDNDQHLISTAISLNNAGTTWFDIFGFVNDAIDSGRITEDNRLVNSSPTLTSCFDLRYALAANDLVGIQALLQGAFGESVRRDDGTAWAYRVGVAVHLDLARRKDIPIGFVAGYKIGTVPDGGDDIVDRTQAFLLNMSYTGRGDLGLGVNFEHQMLPLHGFDQDVSFNSAVITMQYYF